MEVFFFFLLQQQVRAALRGGSSARSRRVPSRVHAARASCSVKRMRYLRKRGFKAQVQHIETC